MEPIWIGIIGLVILFLLMFLGVPIAFCMAAVGFVGFVIINGASSALSMIGLVQYSTVASYTFSVLPVFLIMGEFAVVSGLMRDAYRTMHTWLGPLKGGLAMATIGGCAAFAAVCGSSLATAVTMCRVSLPEMLKYKYKPGLATGAIAAGGTLGILIPPSGIMVLYGIIAEESVGRLLIAGILPGLLLSLMFMVAIYIVVRINPQNGPAGVSTSWREKMTSLKDVWGVLVLFFVVMGGIWFGIFTPTEAAAVGAVIAFLFVVLRRQFNRKNMVSIFLNTAKTSGMIFCILIAAMIFSYFMAVSGLPMALANFVKTLSISPLIVVIAILLVYIILGCIMETIGMTLLTLPIFLPVLSSLGIDIIWFGVLYVIMVELGSITPPIGMNVFAIAGMAKNYNISMYAIFGGLWPFALVMVICVAMLIAFPQIALFLPNTMMGQ